MLLFESVGGPLWVFVGFGDVPSPWTLASGALLIGALVGHEIAAMYAYDEDLDEGSPPGGLMGSRVPSISSLPSSPLFPPKKSAPLLASPFSASPFLASPSSRAAVAYGVPLLSLDGSGSPLKGRGSPLKGSGSPLKGRGLPLKGRGSPLKGRGSPLKGRGSPLGKGRAGQWPSYAPPERGVERRNST